MTVVNARQPGFATIDLLADVSDYFPTGSGFTPITNPTRILDTRNAIGT